MCYLCSESWQCVICTERAGSVLFVSRVLAMCYLCRACWQCVICVEGAGSVLFV